MIRALQTCAVLAALGLTLFAQAPAQGPWSETPPAPDPNAGDAGKRAVARVSVINGVVSVRRGDSGDAVAAAINAPLTETNRLLTGEGSRAEIQFDALNMIRLGPGSEVRLGELAYHHYQVQIASGTTTFRVLRDNSAEIEISTPSIAAHPLKKGVYRVTVKPDGTSEVTVRQGEAEISSPKGTEKLGAGKTMEARGTAGDPEFQIGGQIPPDPWDKWNADRDHDLESSPSGRYVNPDINGTEELDANGRWVNDPAYGQVWVPTVDPGWAPYRVGRWVWVDSYGWTWVSADPWGWAPYHYGRWYQGPYGWAWWPGALNGPYYWQPALVGFFGWGGLGVGFGFGNVGWVALAPYERFYPGYGRGLAVGAVVRGVNVANIYRNARVSNGVTSMAAGQFGRAGVTSATNIRASSADLARAGSVRGGVPMTPSRESTHFSSASAGAAGVPHSSENSHFYSSHPSSASSATHQTFEQQRQAVAHSVTGYNNAASAARLANSPGGSAIQHSGPPTSTSQSTNSVSVRSAAPASPGTAPANTGHTNTPATSSQAGGWQRFNGTNSTPQSVRVNPSVVQSRGSGTTSTGSSKGSSSPAPSRGGSAGAPRGGGGGASHGGGGGRR